MSDLLLWSSAPILVLICTVFLHFRPKRFVATLPGPPCSSWLLGNIPDIDRTENVGDVEFKWVEKYGNVLRFKDAFGVDVLHITDPKALQHILGDSEYNYLKTKVNIGLSRIVTGKGMLAVDGLTHSRHRKIMNPAFTKSSLNEHLPIFIRTTQKASNIWRDIVSRSGEESTVIDIYNWLPRLTLDAFGEAALDYRFDSLDNGDNELAKVYRNLFTDTFFNPSDADIIFRSVFAYLPIWMFRVLQFIPLSGMKRIRNYLRVAFRVAQRIVDRELAAISNGKPPGKDVMSLLVRANVGENPKGRLSDHEVLSEMSTILMAGHETSASTICWFLYELSRHPEYQHRIREETRVARIRAAARGDDGLTVTDLESMAYTVAAMKETLRFHPVAAGIARSAGRDDNIPLSKPHMSVTGEPFMSVPVSKGQTILMSISAHNRLKDLWGDDAHEWNPMRFIEGNMSIKQNTGVGVYANLATFSSGPRSCIGWRFAILEVQAVIIELIDNFEFGPAPGNLEIIRAPTVVMSAMVKGQIERGTQLPLMVTPI